MRLSLTPFKPRFVLNQTDSMLISGIGFDWLMVALSMIFGSGLVLDGWAHNHGKVDESFFTPWHAFFYGGFALLVAVLIGVVLLNWRRGAAMTEAIPGGYLLSMVGALVFAAGGVGDLVWHTLFGIEEDLEALLSPTHLLLGVGMALIMTGPLRAAWRRPANGSGWKELGPALLSMCWTMSVFTFLMMFAHPVTVVVAGARHRYFLSDAGQMAGILGLIVTAGLLVGPILFLMMRWRLPFGAITVIWGINTIIMLILDYEHRYTVWMVVAMILAAVVMDGLNQWLRPGPTRVAPLRLWAFLAPVFLYSGYFAALLATEGTRWTIHLWMGGIVLGGLCGFLLSFLVAPPEHPGHEWGT